MNRGLKMKILHCADIHLGSKMEAKLPKEKSDVRKTEVRGAFNRAVEYAQRHGIKVILLCGDVFDSDRPLKKDKDFFYSVVKNNSDIDFLYLRGNHDTLESYTEYGLENLKTFSTAWTSYEHGDVCITGVESAEENSVAMYSSLNLDKTKKNIVMLHGQIGDTSGKDKINLNKLRNKNIDYLALGHIHYVNGGKLDERGKYVYPGCLEGRGFDEAGEKGFVIIDTDCFSYDFVGNSCRMIREENVDISGAADAYSSYKIIKNIVNCPSKDILRVNLTGEVSFDGDGLERELEELLSGDYYFVSVKNKTSRRFSAEELAGDISLKGEFIRTVLKSDYPEDEKNKIISVGLRALSGREVE